MYRNHKYNFMEILKTLRPLTQPLKAASTITKPTFHETQSFPHNIMYRNHKHNCMKILKTLRPLTLRHRRTGTRGLYARRSCLLRRNSQRPVASSTVTPYTPAHDRTTVMSFCLSPLRRTCGQTRHIRKFPDFHGWCRPNVGRLRSDFVRRSLNNTTLQTVGTFSSYTVQEPTGPSLNTWNLRGHKFNVSHRRHVCKCRLANNISY